MDAQLRNSEFIKFVQRLGDGSLRLEGNTVRAVRIVCLFSVVSVMCALFSMLPAPPAPRPVLGLGHTGRACLRAHADCRGCPRSLRNRPQRCSAPHSQYSGRARASDGRGATSQLGG